VPREAARRFSNLGEVHRVDKTQRHRMELYVGRVAEKLEADPEYDLSTAEVPMWIAKSLWLRKHAWMGVCEILLRLQRNVKDANFLLPMEPGKIELRARRSDRAATANVDPAVPAEAANSESPA